MIYLASPYSSPSSELRYARFVAARDETLRLIHEGNRVFSPIAYSHQFANETQKEGFGFWEKFDLEMIDAAEAVWVLMLPGWKESVGVSAEIRYAQSKGKLVVYFNPGEEVS